MRNRLRRIVALLRIELGVSYRFPVLEGLAAFTFFGPLWNTMYPAWFADSFQIDDFHAIIYALIGVPKIQLQSGVVFCAGWLIPLIPILSSFAVAKSFEDGFVQTLITYPVNRAELLLVKTTLIIMIPTCACVFSFLLALVIAFPQPPLLSDITVVLLGLCLSSLFFASLSLLIAVASRKVSTTAVFGIAYAFVTSLVQDAALVPTIVRAVLNPVNAAGRFLLDSAAVIVNEQSMTIVDLQYGFSISLAMSVTLLVVSLWIFKRVEV